MPSEDEHEFAQFAEGFRADHEPVGETESFLVERIIGLAWRLRRAGRLETDILGAQTSGVPALREGTKSARSQQESQEDHLTVIKGLSAHKELRRLLERQKLLSKAELEWALPIVEELEKENPALAEASKRWMKERAAPPTYGEAFIVDTKRENSLAKLSRYETSIERSFYKALHELQRMQAARQGKDVPLPIAVDVDVSGIEPQTN
jgi:hypothetical protein